MAIYVICDYYIHKTDLADLSSFKEILYIFENFRGEITKYLLPLESGNLQLEQTNFPLFSLFSLCRRYPALYSQQRLLRASFRPYPTSRAHRGAERLLTIININTSPLPGPQPPINPHDGCPNDWRVSQPQITHRTPTCAGRVSEPQITPRTTTCGGAATPTPPPSHR